MKVYSVKSVCTLDKNTYGLTYPAQMQWMLVRFFNLVLFGLLSNKPVQTKQPDHLKITISCFAQKPCCRCSWCETVDCIIVFPSNHVSLHWNNNNFFLNLLFKAELLNNDWQHLHHASFRIYPDQTKTKEREWRTVMLFIKKAKYSTLWWDDQCYSLQPPVFIYWDKSEYIAHVFSNEEISQIISSCFRSFY